MSITKTWTDDAGHEGTYHEDRLSIFAGPSMTRDDGWVAVGINAPWINEFAEAVGHARVLAEFGEWIRRGQSHPCPVEREHVDAAITAIGALPFRETDAPKETDHHG